MHKKLSFAIPSIVIASLINSFMAAFVKEIEGQITVFTISFIRNLLSLGALWVILLFQPPRGELIEKVKTSRLGLLCFRGIAGVLAIFLYFYSLHFLSLTDATLLFFTAPIFVPLVTYFWKKSKIHKNIFLGLVVGFIGVIFVIKPGMNVFHYTSILALLSGLFSAMGQVATRYLQSTESSNKVIFYFFLVATIISGIGSLFFYQSDINHLTPFFIVLLIGIAITGFFYQFFLTLALKHAPAKLITPLLFIGVIFTMILDWIVWDKSPSLLTVIGLVLIVIGVCLTIFLYPKHEDPHG